MGGGDFFLGVMSLKIKFPPELVSFLCNGVGGRQVANLEKMSHKRRRLRFHVCCSKIPGSATGYGRMERRNVVQMSELIRFEKSISTKSISLIRLYELSDWLEAWFC